MIYEVFSGAFAGFLAGAFAGYILVAIRLKILLSEVRALTNEYEAWKLKAISKKGVMARQQQDEEVQEAIVEAMAIIKNTQLSKEERTQKLMAIAMKYPAIIKKLLKYL